MESATYWKLKAVELEGTVLQRRIDDTIAQYQRKRTAAYAEAGLDPARTYALDDDAETAEDVRPDDHV